MGCFSFMCKVSGEPGLSTSFDGSPVHLFLLKDGKVIEHMHGNYDSYGRVFGPTKDPEDKSMTDKTSFEWNMDWSEVCDLMFSKNKGDGIALIHDKFWSEGDPYPTEQSDDDPNQGWGEDYKLIGSTATGGFREVEEPFHKVFSK